MLSFPKLAAHLQWADARALAALRDAEPPNARALEIYAHVLGAEHTELSRIAGRPAPTDYIAFVRGAPAATRR